MKSSLVEDSEWLPDQMITLVGKEGFACDRVAIAVWRSQGENWSRCRNQSVMVTKDPGFGRNLIAQLGICPDEYPEGGFRAEIVLNCELSIANQVPGNGYVARYGYRDHVHSLELKFG